MGNYRAEVEKTGPEVQINHDLVNNLNLGPGPIPAERQAIARRLRRIRKMKIAAAILLVLIVLVALASSCLFRNPAILSYPIHASCNVTWTLSQDCKSVSNLIAGQIDAWTTNETCGSGQKCLYSLVTQNDEILKATHTTPVKGYIDDLTFFFYPNSATEGCNVQGFSTSQIWYAVLDYGTNYCNLHNLFDGAGLTQDRLYSELTHDEICTQYTSADCDKY